MILSRVLLVPFVAVVLVFGTLVYHFATNIRSQAVAKLAYIADAHQDIIEEFLREKSFDIQYIAASNSFEQLGQEARLDEILKLLQAQSGAFLDLGVFDSEGNHIADREILRLNANAKITGPGIIGNDRERGNRPVTDSRSDCICNTGGCCRRLVSRDTRHHDETGREDPNQCQKAWPLEFPASR